MFGKPTFGTAAPSTSFGFGQTSTPSNPFGQNQTLFSKPMTGFGNTSTGTFGQTTTWTGTGAFGTAQTTQSGFGSTGLFGQQTTGATGLFNTTSTFGQQNKPGTFGFGATQQTPGLFGTQPSTSTLFNSSTASTGLFGQSSAFTSQPTTGTVIKFNPVTGTDTMMKNGSAQSINTKIICITAMKEYENKSLEELRLEDYQANRKGPQQAAPFGGPAFGATPTATPLFGQTDASKSAFGQTTAFGQTATPAFGQATTGAFGIGSQPAAAATPFGAKPAFGANTSTNFGFGSNTAQNANPFGVNTANKPFGAVTTQPLFGANTTQTSGAFSTGLFSNTQQNTSTSLFGKPAQPVTAFGATSTGFGFNTATTTQPSLFTNTAKPLFGAPTTSTSAFGSGLSFGTNTMGFNSSFGKPAAPAFGTTQTTPFGSTLGATNQNTSLFGNTNQPKPGLFGNTSTTGLFSNPSNTLSSFPATNTFNLGQPQQQQSLFSQPEQQTSNLALLTNDPFGLPPHLIGLEPKPKTDNYSSISTTDPKELKTLLDVSKKVDLSHNSKLKVTPLRNIRDSLFDSLSSPKDSYTSPLADYQKPSCRRLIIKRRENTPNLSSTNILDALEDESVTENNSNHVDTKESTKNSYLVDTNISAISSVDLSHNAGDKEKCNASIETRSGGNDMSTSRLLSSDATETSSKLLPSMSFDDEDRLGTPDEAGDKLVKTYPSKIICTRPEYYTLPKLDEIVPDSEGRCLIEGFTVGRVGYGNVYFPDEIDLTGLNIDEYVHFRYREVNIYPDDSKKPPVGKGLNRRAQVTLDNVFPRRAGTNALIRDVSELLQMNFAEKLRRITEKKNARFVDYRPETGSWVFKVDHFSKYGFNDSDEETDENGKIKLKKGFDKTVTKPVQDTTKKPLGDTSETNTKQPTGTDNASAQLKDATTSQATEKSEGLIKGLSNDIVIDYMESQDNNDNDDGRKPIDITQDILQPNIFVDFDHLDQDEYQHVSTDVPLSYQFSPYAKHAKNIQLMKSSLFAEDDHFVGEDDTASHISFMKQYHDIPETIDDMSSIHDEIIIKKRPLQKPKVWTVLNNYLKPGTLSPILPNRCYVDMSMFKGKSFKVGWGKGFNFYSVGNNKTELQVNVIDASPNFDPMKDVLIDCLSTALQQSTYKLDASSIPTFSTIKGPLYMEKETMIFQRLATQYNSSSANYLSSIWRLCTALWGPDRDDSIASRRHLLSEWLQSACNTEDITLNLGPYKLIEDALNTIFEYLSIFKIYEAADIAMTNQLPHLALLLAQLSVSNDTKNYLQEQIEVWYNSSASNFMDKEMKKLYLLLAGIPVKDDINIFEGLDWKRTFGMHLWYICPNGAPVEMAIDLYKKAFEEHLYAERPNPPYSKHYTENGPFDIIYHILLLYKTNVYRLSTILNPATYTSDPLDYRLSWLLLQLFLSLDTGIINVSEKYQITMSFSNQLEQLGYWEWAIYVLLYLDDNLFKKNRIFQILDRHLLIDNVDDETTRSIINLLVNQMKIPSEWIHTIKAEKLYTCEKYFEAFNHFILAKNCIKANEIFIKFLLPNLFINEQFDIIKILIEKIQPASDEILNWKCEAGLFADFLDLLEQSIASDNILKLQVKLQSISERIIHFPLNTDQHKVCIAELSKRCASLYKELAQISNTKNLFNETYSDFIQTLVMPPDFKQHEIMYLIESFCNMKFRREQ